LRFVVSSLAIDDFDFHTLIFNDSTGKQKEFFISDVSGSEETRTLMTNSSAIKAKQ